VARVVEDATGTVDPSVASLPRDDTEVAPLPAREPVPGHPERSEGSAVVARVAEVTTGTVDPSVASLPRDDTAMPLADAPASAEKPKTAPTMAVIVARGADL
ncbi:MAG TPA: hypothetical protein VHB25_20400, partial [Gemmatimonadaceae bacterium]|nr:hypothetical protein [Gemmatimonadaceae bacterium]